MVHLYVPVPMAVALIFGTQTVILTSRCTTINLDSPISQDIVRVWMFWKKDVPPSPVPTKDSKTWADDV